MSSRLKNIFNKVTAAVVAVAFLFALNPGIAFAATFGQTSDNGNTQTFSAARMYLSSAAPASSGTVTSATCRNWVSATGSYSSKVVVYTNLAGTPVTSLAESDAVTVSATAEQANVYAFSGANQIAIVSGTTYWFGIFAADPGTPSFVISRANTAAQVHFMSTAYPTVPATFTSGGTAAGPHDCFITYTEAGGGGATTTAQLRIGSGLLQWGSGMLYSR